MRFALLAAVAFTCVATAAQAASCDAVPYIDRIKAALDRAGPKNCQAYEEAIAAGEEAIAIMMRSDCRRQAHNKAAWDAALGEAELGQRSTRNAADKDGCSAASKRDSDQCAAKDIAACTRILESGRETAHNRAIAYSNRCGRYADRRDADRAIADCNEAIRLDPTYAGAYNNRCNAFLAKGDLDHAFVDCNDAIRLDPKLALAYSNRGYAYRQKGDNDRAIADFNEAIRLNPKLALAYFNRGIADLYAGALPKALADLTQSTAIDPKYAYAALWLDIVGKRSKLPSRLAEATAQIDMTKWPAPVIWLFLGQLTPEAVLAAADDPDPATKNGQVCEANFYTGEFNLQQGKKDEATKLFQASAANCPKDFSESFAALSELRALGVAP